MRRRSSVASWVKGVLFGHQAQNNDQKHPKDQVLAEQDTEKPEILPKIIRISNETPSSRWRHREVIVARKDSNVDESFGRVTARHYQGQQEIVFTEKHRQAFTVPRQDKFTTERRLDFVSHKKMRSFVQVLTTPTADTPGTTLLLHFDNKRYLIGSLAEGTQRAAVQMGARMLKVNECFITGRTEWSNTGGLIGMILTLADGAAASKAASTEDGLRRAHGKAKRLGVFDDPEKLKELEDEAKKEYGNNLLTLFGAPNLNHTLATARRFVFRKGMPINAHEIQDQPRKPEGEEEWAPYWADNNIKVWAMSVKPASQSKASASSGRIPSPRPISPRKRSLDELYGRDQPATEGAMGNDDLTSEERGQLTVKAVVGEMFNSSWRLDTLYETPLSHVRMPATIFVRNAETNNIQKYQGPFPGGPQPLPDPNLKVLVRKPWPGALIEYLPHTEPAKEAISYIIRNHAQRGRFHPEKAIALKVEKGHKWSQLSSGEAVQNADGELVKPDQVLGPSKDGGGLAVIDLPSPEYIEPLVNRAEWKEPKVMVGVGAVVWICGEGVAEDSRLRNFIKHELQHLRHIVSSPDYCPNSLALDSAAAATVRLRQVDPARYTIPIHNNDRPASSGMEEDIGAQLAVRGQVVQLEPSLTIDNKQIIKPIDIAATEAETSQEVLDEAKKAQFAIKSDRAKIEAWSANIPSKDAEIITLGTGSALPSKYRNVSATLLRVPGWGNVLLDCGENTLGQLKRVFEPQELRQVIKELRLIVISHMHADHHLGTVSVIKAWYHEVHGGKPATDTDLDSSVDSRFADQQRLAIISEPAMQHWLSEYAAVEDYGFSRLAPLHVSPAVPHKGVTSKLGWFIPPSELASLDAGDRQQKMAANVVPSSLLNLQDVQAVAIQHCHGARAMSITFSAGFKASYSGDCRPSKAFSQIGRGSTVCIHEATFDDELQGDAEAKNHSTTSEALGVAQAMGAKACVLTHFSQRYQKLPILEHGGNDSDNSQAVADDARIPNGVDEDIANPDDSLEGPLEDVASTIPDQVATNGKSYETSRSKSDAAANGTAAVKFKLTSDMKVAVAFDYMRVRVGEIAQLEKLTPALLKLFAEDDKAVSDAGSIHEQQKNSNKKQKGKHQRGNR